MTSQQRADLVLEGFSVHRVLDEGGPWSKYFDMVAQIVDAMKTNKPKVVQDLYKKINLQFNSLQGAEDEDYFNQNRFMGRVEKYLVSNGLSTEL